MKKIIKSELVILALFLILVGYVSFLQTRRSWYEFIDIPAFVSDEAILSKEAGKYPYNFYIETAPYLDDHKEGIFHWRVEFLGRTTVEAGYEHHTGEFVNPTYPEEVAKQLQDIATGFIK